MSMLIEAMYFKSLRFITGLLFFASIASAADELAPPALDKNKEPSRLPQPVAPAPPPIEQDPALKPPAIERVGGDDYKMGEIKFNRATKIIQFPCFVNMDEGQIEYALVHEQGKVHESLLATKVEPIHLQTVLLLCGYRTDDEDMFKEAMVRLKEYGIVLGAPDPDKKAEAPPGEDKKGEDKKAPRLNRFVIEVSWKDAEGKEQRAPLHDWALNIDTKKPMETDYWVFNGSYVREGVFAAQQDHDFFAIYRDVNAIANNPSKDALRDDPWMAYKEKVPAKGTAVTLMISPWVEDKKSETKGK